MRRVTFLLSELFRGLDDMRVNVGVGYRGTSGNPTSFLASHHRYGLNEVHVLPRGSGERLPFVHRFDTHLEYGLLLSKGSVLPQRLRGCIQPVQLPGDHRRGSDLHLRPGPPDRGRAADPRGEDDLDPDPARLVHPDGTPFDVDAEKNPAFGKPSGYQAPRTFRFGMRVRF